MEELREYQDYLLAYRLRALLGGRVAPRERQLGLAAYARLRLERQELAGSIVGQGEYRDRMRRVDALTDRLNFGFWTNPNETIRVMRAVADAGGCRALESEADFIDGLLTPREREVLRDDEAAGVARYYLGLLRASVAYLDPAVFTRLRDEIEPLRETLPIFVVDAAPPGGGAAAPDRAVAD